MLKIPYNIFKRGVRMSDLQNFLDKALKNVEFKERIDDKTLSDYNIELEISELLLATRTENGITQKELADKSGISQANISKFERGNYCPNINTLKKLADAMGKRLKIEFIDEEEL